MFDENLQKIKVIFVGNINVGKTSLINVFNGLSLATISTLAPNNVEKIVTNSRNERVKLDLWDTAGQEQFQSISHLYYRDAKVAVVCYDFDNFNTIQDWITKVRNVEANCTIFIAATKLDLLDQDQVRQVTKMGNEFISTQGTAKMSFVTSSLTKLGISQLFGAIADVNFSKASANTIELANSSNKHNNHESNSKSSCCS